MIRSTLAVLLLLAATTSVSAQIIQTPSGPLEFIGLRHRTPQQLWDSIYAMAPGTGAHACGATLMQTFHYADASSSAYPEGDSLYWVVVVIEPESASRVQYRARPAAAGVTQADWSNLYNQHIANPFLLQSALSSYPFILKNLPDSARTKVLELDESLTQFGHADKATANDVSRIWEYLGKHRTEDDLNHALQNTCQ